MALDSAGSKRIKARGREWEKYVAEFYIDNGFPQAERKRLAGAFDAGDITGIVGLTVECKNAKVYDVTRWLKQLDVEIVNNGTEYGVLHFKLIRGKAGDHPVVMRESMWAKILDIPGVREAMNGQS